MSAALAGERQILLDAILIRGVNPGGAAQGASALGVLGLAEVPSARAGAQDLAAGGDFEPLGCGFLSFNALRTSHINQLSFKKSAQYRGLS